MYKNIIALLVTGLLLSCGAAPAFAKGMSSGRSYSRPTVVHQHVTVNKTTVVHEGNSGGGNGLLTGMVVGSMLANHNNQPVIVQPQPVQVVQPQAVAPVIEQPTVVQTEEKNDTPMILGFIAFLAICACVLMLHKQNKDKHHA